MVAFHLGVAFYGISLISTGTTTSIAFTQVFLGRDLEISKLLSLSMLLRFVNTEHGTSQQYKRHCDSLYNQRGHVPQSTTVKIMKAPWGPLITSSLPEESRPQPCA